MKQFNKKPSILKMENYFFLTYIHQIYYFKWFLRNKDMKTYFPKEGEKKKEWYIINAAGTPLGRLASQLATILQGKNKPLFTPHSDMGDFVVVVNAEKIKLTGRKLTQKTYKHHSGYPGGLRTINAKTMLDKKPEEIIIHAVKGMLPKTTLGRHILKKLKVYRGEMHPHKAQKPILLSGEVKGA